MPIVPNTSLKNDLEIADTSLCFQVILVISGVISLFGSRSLRDQLIADLCGKTVSACPGLKIKIFANVIIFVCLIYFLFDAQYNLRQADNPPDCLVAQVELMAAILVLLASGLRLYSLSILNRGEVSEPEEIELGESPVIQTAMATGGFGQYAANTLNTAVLM